MTVLYAQPQVVKLSVNFEGCTAECVPKFQIILPAGMVIIIGFPNNHYVTYPYTVGLQPGPQQKISSATDQPVMPLHGNHRYVHTCLQKVWHDFLVKIVKSYKIQFHVLGCYLVIIISKILYYYPCFKC